MSANTPQVFENSMSSEEMEDGNIPISNLTLIMPPAIKLGTWPPPDRPEPPKEKTKGRVSMACTRCKTKKIKCEGDGNSACPGCIQVNEPCIYDKRPFAPQTSYPAGYIEMLLDEIAVLKTALRLAYKNNQDNPIYRHVQRTAWHHVPVQDLLLALIETPEGHQMRMNELEENGNVSDKDAALLTADEKVLWHYAEENYPDRSKYVRDGKVDRLIEDPNAPLTSPQEDDTNGHQAHPSGNGQAVLKPTTANSARPTVRARGSAKKSPNAAKETSDAAHKKQGRRSKKSDGHAKPSSEPSCSKRRATASRKAGANVAALRQQPTHDQSQPQPLGSAGLSQPGQVIPPQEFPTGNMSSCPVTQSEDDPVSIGLQRFEGNMGGWQAMGTVPSYTAAPSGSWPVQPLNWDQSLQGLPNTTGSMLDSSFAPSASYGADAFTAGTYQVTGGIDNSNGHGNGHGNGYSNGNGYGYGNGHGNGHVNGHGNGTTIGYGDGTGNGTGEGSGMGTGMGMGTGNSAGNGTGNGSDGPVQMPSFDFDFGGFGTGGLGPTGLESAIEGLDENEVSELTIGQMFGYSRIRRPGNWQ